MAKDLPKHPSTSVFVIRQPLIGVNTFIAEFSRAMREILARIKTQLRLQEKTADKAKLVSKIVALVEPFLTREDLDDGLRTVLKHTKLKLEKP